MSLGPDGVQGNDNSRHPTISASGRFVAFVSRATNLVPGKRGRDFNYADVFVRDRQLRLTKQVSLGIGGAQTDGRSVNPSISADGRFIAFESDADNLVPGDTNGFSDVFVANHRSGTVQRVSVGPLGAQADFGGSEPTISANGRFVAFSSGATNLVPGVVDYHYDIFIHDLAAGTTQRVSLTSDAKLSNGDSFGPTISADGLAVAFSSYATNLVPGGSNGFTQVFVRDRRMQTTEFVSLGRQGVQGNGDSYAVAISADGRYVAFYSDATNLVLGDTNAQADLFVRDRKLGKTERVNVGPRGVQSNLETYGASISADGRFVAFASSATNLVPDDTNGNPDVFVRDRKRRTTQRVSIRQDGTQDDCGGWEPALSATGRIVAFDSNSAKLVPGFGGPDNVFVRISSP